MKKLTLKQVWFIKEYLRTGNGTQAAMSVYKTAKPEVASSIATENLRKPLVKQEIERLLATSGFTLSEISKKLRVSIDSGLGRYAKNADSIRGIELALKLHGSFPTNKSIKAVASPTEAYNHMSVDELQIELVKTREQSERLLKDLNEN